ncbi:MAG: hypothetical protein ACHQJ6_03010 [Candidatus Berkiellales bacterium]
MKNVALTVSGLIFLAMAIVHALRYFSKHWVIVVNHFIVPVNWSLYGGIVALVLAIWMFSAASKK